jgi:addiction module HigA family antidote
MPGTWPGMTKMKIMPPVPHLGRLLNGRRSITADTTVRLGRYFGSSARFWLGLQGQYDITECRAQ